MKSIESLPQYSSRSWPWGDMPRLVRTPWPPSPWRSAFFDGSHEYEHSILIALVMYLVIHCMMRALSKRVGYPLSLRPTIICGTLHATGTAVSASALLLCGFPGSVWQRKVLPFSIAYFLADILLYCVPKRDLTMTLHHLVMIGCHYPLGEPNGALVAGAGDPHWALWLAVVGYLSEWTTALLHTHTARRLFAYLSSEFSRERARARRNLRWVLAHTMREHHAAYGVVSFLLLLTYLYRLALFPYLICFQIVPRYAVYVARQQILTFYIMLLGHIIVLQLSVQWCTLIWRHGVRNFLIFTPKKKTPGTHFNWRDNAFAGIAKPGAPAPLPASRKRE